MRKLILTSNYALGDIVLMTAAVRDLHKCYPGAFRTDVRTTCGQIWNYNPYLEHLEQNDPEVEIVPCEPKLTNWSNTVPYHIIESFIDNLNEKLGLHIRCTDFKGDLHLSFAEKRAQPAIHQLVGRPLPYWLIFAGGRHEITIKWWDPQRYQQVVDHFAGKIQFVQAGGTMDYHPKLRGTIDLRGKTSFRGLMQLMYHADGVLCGVTGPMHLAAAVPVKSRSAALRPCVVVAGGREPPHWASYPGHQFIHTVGALPCCASGGCWKRRVFPLGDGTAEDALNEMCVDVQNGLPHCMDLISADNVISRIELFLRTGRVRILSPSQARAGKRGEKLTLQNPLDERPLRLDEARYSVKAFLQSVPQYPAMEFKGSGIVLPVLNLSEAINGWLLIRRLRELGCALPVELWCWGGDCINPALKAFLSSLDVRCIDAFEHKKQTATLIVKGPQIKPYAIKHSRFSKILLLSPDLRPSRNPDYLLKGHARKGILCWPQLPHKLKADAWHLCGLKPSPENPIQSSVMVLDKKLCWPALSLWLWFYQQAHIYHLVLNYSEDAAHMALRKTNVPLAICGLGPDGELKDPGGKMLFRWTDGIRDFAAMNGRRNGHSRNRDWLDLEALRAAHRAEARIQPTLERIRL